MEFKRSDIETHLETALLEEAEQELCGRVEWRKLKALRTIYGHQGLEQLYWRTCAYLRGRQPLAEQQTHAECKFLRVLRRHTKLRLFPSFWIGRSCFDVFIPAVRGGVHSKMRGLVIEIDGPVHLIENKMKKDEARGEMLRQFGIVHMALDNMDLGGELPQLLISELKTFRRLDHRARRRLLGNVHAWTVLVNEKYLPEGRHDPR